MRYYYQNVRGLRTKLDTLRQNIPTLNYDVYCLTETWLYDQIFSPELGFTNYDVYRLDRKNVIGGGVLISIRKIFRSKLLN